MKKEPEEELVWVRGAGPDAKIIKDLEKMLHLFTQAVEKDVKNKVKEIKKMSKVFNA